MTQSPHHYSHEELMGLGLAEVGEGAVISRKASFYNTANIRIGRNSRIDDFCIISAGAGGVIIGHRVHIACYTSIIGAGQVSIADFANISSRVSIFSSSDDYSGESLTSPLISDHLKKVDTRPVYVGKHAIVGCGTVVLPGAYLSDGSAIGALSLVKGLCHPDTIYAGVPIRKLGARSPKYLELAARLPDPAKPDSWPS